jgi:hypothetical protein
MEARTVWLENLVLLNKCVRESGGTMDITSSYTDAEGDVAVRVRYNFITPAKFKEYESHSLKLKRELNLPKESERLQVLALMLANQIREFDTRDLMDAILNNSWPTLCDLKGDDLKQVEIDMYVESLDGGGYGSTFDEFNTARFATEEFAWRYHMEHLSEIKRFTGYK